MTSVSRDVSRTSAAFGLRRAALLRTAASALIASSPFLYSGASSATVKDVQLTAPVVPSKQIASKPISFLLASSANLQLASPRLWTGFSAGILSSSDATAFTLSAPAFDLRSFTGTPVTKPQQVQDLLAVPMTARSGSAMVPASSLSVTPMAASIDYSNSNNITVGSAETAIDIDGGVDSVTVNNTGDLTGGGGIRVSTSKFDAANASLYAHNSLSWTSNYTAPLYDATTGDPLLQPCWEGSSYSCHVYDVYARSTITAAVEVLDASQTDAQITINNGGRIDFSGLYGITADNEAGAGITINNSGDITSTEDTARRVGIHADTDTYYRNVVTEGPTVVVPGEITVIPGGPGTDDDKLTGVITVEEREKTYTSRLHGNDLGSISITNNAAIDMGVVDVSEIPQGYIPAYTQSEGIYARGFGGIDIVNSGSASIKVGDFSNGITTISAGNVNIQNAGRIEIGNRSAGIYAMAGSQPSGDIYSHGGDTTIVNTGDIVGGMTKAEAEASPNTNAFGAPNYQSGIRYLTGATGIRAYSLGTNVNGYGGMAEYVEILQGYGFDAKLSDLRGNLPGHPAPPAGLTPEEEEAWWASFEPKLKNSTTTIANRGNISLKDGGLGIYGTAMYGDMRAYNGGSIAVGNGDSHFADNADARAIGIYMNNVPISGSADFYAKNEASGIISTGDDAGGIMLRSAGGSVTAINEGAIIVGNGGVGDHTYQGETYDWLFPSLGMSSTTVGTSLGQTAIASNSGSITTGDLSTGINVLGNSGGFAIPYLPYRTTAYLINKGSVTTGDNSSGLVASGNNTIVYSSGSVTIGDKDLSGFDLPPDPKSASSFYFGRAGYGILASATGYSTVYNAGSVTTGDNTVGISNSNRRTDWGLTVHTVQTENGIVSTGDNSVGIKSSSHLYTVLDNAGTVSVGDNSVGVDLKAGSVYHDYYHQPVVTNGRAAAVNSGLIQTGDNSTGIRLIGAELNAVHNWEEFDFNTGQYTPYSLTADILGQVSLYNTGTVRVGANSTAVELAGKGFMSAIANPDFDAGSPVSADNLPFLPNPDYDPNDVNSEPYLMTESAPQLISTGTIDAGDGVAIKANVATGIDTTIFNGGTIAGDILFGDGDDLLFNAQDVDPQSGAVLSTGNIIMNGNTIDFGGGSNTFRIKNGVVSIAGGDNNLITGDNLTIETSYGEFDARDEFITGASAASLSAMAVPFATGTNFSTLTINGDISGSLRFATDVGAGNQSDKLIIAGDVLDGSEIGVVVNPVEQLKGNYIFAPITIEGTNDADLVEFAGATGKYADSLVSANASYDPASHNVLVKATFGMGHLATAANGAAISAGNWLTSSIANFETRNVNAYTQHKGEGLSVWGFAFQDEGTIRPHNNLQKTDFSEITSGLEIGAHWSKRLGSGTITFGPNLTYGTVEANLKANTASSRGHPWAAGLNANYVSDGGFYAEAVYQHMGMDIRLKAPDTATQATGDTNAKGNAFNVEAGYSYSLSKGITLQPQLQLTHINVDLDNLTSSDGFYDLTDISSKSSTARAGISLFKVIPTSDGTITPLVSLSYLNVFGSNASLDSNGLGFGNDMNGSGYNVELAVLGNYKKWDFAGRVAFSKTSASGSIFHPSLNVRYSFGGDSAKAAPATAAGTPQLSNDVKLNTSSAAPSATQGATSPATESAPATATDGAPAAAPNTAATPDVSGVIIDQKAASQEAQGTPPSDVTIADSNGATPEGQPTDQGAIVVTGTLIRRSTNSDITPMSIVTEKDMQVRGLQTVGDVMRSFTENKGYTEGKSSNLLGRFTVGAEEVNFRGLGTGRTLVLVNGRRVADYPLPFGGEQNGVDLGTIPMAAIAKVEYLSAGASATYGSDAVGGVVNIITKRDMEQTQADLTLGGYQGGFGEGARASIVTGKAFSRGSFTVGAEGAYSGEFLASDVKWFRENAPFNAQMVSLVENTASGRKSVLPPSACEPLGFTFDHDTCSADVSNTISLNPKTWRASAFFDGRFDLTDQIELFATGMVSFENVKNRSNVLFWEGVVGNDDLTSATFITRGFSEGELGIQDVNLDQNMETAVVGGRGGFDVSGNKWYWDAALSYARYGTTQKSTNLKEEGIKNWILDGATTVIDSPDQQYTYFVDNDFYQNQLVDNVVRKVAPGDVDGLIGTNVLKGKSSSTTFTATLNGQFGDLGFMAKPGKFAVRGEYGHQMTEIIPDARTLNTTGQGWYGIGAIYEKGTRDRWAVAGEVDATPISDLDVTLAARYDRYYDDSDVKGRVTGSAKFLYRATNWLKVRGGVGQTFRAPDMFNIYGVSQGFEYVPDLSAPGCDGGTGPNCLFTQVATTRRGDPGLSDEHGFDLGLGGIFNPFPNFTFTVDWYRIKLKNLVITEPAYDVVLKEYQCNTGVLDPTSKLCQDIYSRVIRNGFGAIEEVIIEPINQSSLIRSGVDIRAQYEFESEKLGQFTVGVSWSGVGKFDLTRFAGDKPIDLRYGEPGAAEPQNSLGASLSWYQPLSTGKAISAGLFVQRTGRVYNYTQTQFLDPWYDVNLTVGYQLNATTQARFSVNNLINTHPQKNGSGFWPGFWAQLQTPDALGRSFYLSLGKSFK